MEFMQQAEKQNPNQAQVEVSNEAHRLEALTVNAMAHPDEYGTAPLVLELNILRGQPGTFLRAVDAQLSTDKNDPEHPMPNLPRIEVGESQLFDPKSPISAVELYSQLGNGGQRLEASSDYIDQQGKVVQGSARLANG